MNKQLSNCIDRHRTACEMAAKTRNLPRLVMWFSHEYSGEFPLSCDSEETLSKALLQFYPPAVIAIDPRNAPAVHEWTGPTGVKFRDVRSAAGTYYHDTTPPAVVAALDSAMQSGARVRFWYGDRETGKSWLDEFNVCGTVGRSTGWKRTALILSNRRSHGGPAILADSIVRLMVDGREVYRHPQFSQPALAVSTDPVHLAKGYPAAVLADGERVARFKSTAAASRWVAFMEGRRACK